jgi:hypothetical protein
MRAGALHYATYFDRHYLLRGLALYRSLRRQSPEFTLWVLCLDDQTYQTLSRLRLDGVELIPLAELECHDPALLKVKAERRLYEYYWTSGPSFLLYLLEREPRIETITYLDADLYFFGSPAPLYEELGAHSILLIEHNFAASVPPITLWRGTYNVGLLVFRRTEESLACLSRWRERCLDWCFDRVEPDRFGDQKYLDEWPARFRGVTVSQNRGASLAPWSLGRFRVGYDRGRVVVEGDPLVFYHFNRLRAVTTWLYDAGMWRHNQQMPRIVRQHVYVPYVRELRRARKLIVSAGAEIEPADSLRSQGSLLTTLAHSLRHRQLLVVTDSLVV